MSKKKKTLYITLASIVILICCVSLAYLLIHFIQSHDPNHKYIQQFNHTRYYFESSDNAEVTTALSQPDKNNKRENFYIMHMGITTMVSCSKSKVISFEGGKTNTNFSQNRTKITLKNQMQLDCKGRIYTAKEIEFLSSQNKMSIAFYSGNTQIATAIFAPQ